MVVITSSSSCSRRTESGVWSSCRHRLAEHSCVAFHCKTKTKI